MKRLWLSESIHLLFQSIYSGLQLGHGFYQLSRLQGPIVSVFGGRWVENENKYIKQAYNLSGQLVEHGFSVITGGGPGLMSAANCGAQEKKEELGIKKECTLGVCVEGVDVGFDNPCARSVQTRFFFVRKWLLTRYSSAIVVFPGGIGTVDEFFDILNLQKFDKIKLIPVVLVGRSYWKGLIEWYDQSIEQGIILPKFKNLFTATDNLEEVLSLIKTRGDKSSF